MACHVIISIMKCISVFLVYLYYSCIVVIRTVITLSSTAQTFLLNSVHIVQLPKYAVMEGWCYCFVCESIPSCDYVSIM